MLRVSHTALLLTTLALIVPGIGWAASSISIEAFGSFNGYSMDDANEDIGSFQNRGLDFGELKHAAGGGVGIRMAASPSVTFSLVWEPHLLNTRSADGHSYRLDASSIQLTGAYYLPATGALRHGFGAGVSRFALDGEAPHSTIDGEGNPIWGRTEMAGSGLGFHVLGLTEWKAWGPWSVTGAAGLRFAQIEVDDRMDATTADYSGFMGRIGLAFDLPITP